MTVGLKDLAIDGDIVFRLDPMIDEAPLIGGFGFYFLDPPSIDFELTGLSALSKVGGSEGLKGIIQKVAVQSLSSFMVLPNRIAVPLGTHEQGVIPADVKHPSPIGVLRVKAISAKGLTNSDYFGKSDPFVSVTVGGTIWKSSTIWNSLDPVWENQSHDFLIWTLRQRIDISVWDEDSMSYNDRIGAVREVTTVSDAVEKKGQDMKLWQDDGKSSGSLKMSFQWLNVVPRMQKHSAHSPKILVITIKSVIFNGPFDDTLKVSVSVAGTDQETAYVSKKEKDNHALQSFTHRVVQKLSDKKQSNAMIADVLGITIEEVQQISKSANADVHLSKPEVVFDTLFYQFFETQPKEGDVVKLTLNGKESGKISSCAVSLASVSLEGAECKVYKAGPASIYYQMSWLGTHSGVAS
eukprot:TRINITY_DN14028_c1_g1_i1.p1 TRINITY_DN14028_c1_g1~~TRINITY_DN14028_c1_g1_i1.p1  ORF type:complete len:446 (+),score=46.56 TRINITY_DN14028_c1_g1_i1:112-1338(+)